MSRENGNYGASARNEKINVVSGIRIGRLTIGELAHWVKEHPAYELTPISYLRQGRLRECFCDCGEIRLISETHLATGRIKSCGCLRRERKELGLKKKVSKIEMEMEQARLTGQLRMEQAKLAQQRAALVKDEDRIAEHVTRIREILQQKTNLANRISSTRRRAKQRLRYKERKLREEYGIGTTQEHESQEQPK